MLIVAQLWLWRKFCSALHVYLYKTSLFVQPAWCRAPCISPKIVIDGNFMSLKQQIFAFSLYHFDFTFNFNYCTCHNRCMLYDIHDVSMKAAIHLIFFLPGSSVLLS